jgi:hypothetical protein
MKFCCGGRVNSPKEVSDFAKVTAFEVIVTCAEESICLDYFFLQICLELKNKKFTRNILCIRMSMQVGHGNCFLTPNSATFKHEVLQYLFYISFM